MTVRLVIQTYLLPDKCTLYMEGPCKYNILINDKQGFFEHINVWIGNKVSIVLFPTKYDHRLDLKPRSCILKCKFRNQTWLLTLTIHTPIYMYIYIIVFTRYLWTTTVEDLLRSLGKFIYLFIKYRYELTTGRCRLVKAIYMGGISPVCILRVKIDVDFKGIHVPYFRSMVSRAGAPFTIENKAIDS